MNLSLNPRLAPVLALGAFMLVGADRPLPAVRAQAAPVVYTHRETWAGRDLPVPYQVLDWPTGHVAGGIGHDIQTGRLFVTDLTAGRLRVYAADRRFVETVGRPGAGPGELDAPRDVAVLRNAERDLAISDTGNGRVQIVSQAGVPRAEVRVDDPQGIAAALPGGADGAAFHVVARGARRLAGFDDRAIPTGAALLDTSGAFRSPEGLLNLDAVLGVVGGGAIGFAVADPRAGELRVVQVAGGTTAAALGPVILELPGLRAVGQWFGTGPTGGPSVFTLVGATGLGLVLADSYERAPSRIPFDDVRDIEVTVGGEVYAAVEPDGLVYFGRGGELVDRLTWPAGRLRDPLQIAVGDDLLLTDAGPRVQIWGRDGAPLGRLLTPAGAPPLDVAASGTRRYALDGELAPAVAGIRRIESGRWTQVWAPPAGGQHQLVAVAAQGERVAALDLVDQSVWLLDAELRETGRWSLADPGDFRGVLDLALGESRVFLGDQQRSELDIRALDGRRVATVKIPTGPLRLAAGPGDTVFVLTASKWVFLYGPDGQPLGAWPAGRPQDRPVDLAVDASDILYVLDAAGDVRVYTPDARAPSQLPPPAGAGICSTVRDKSASPREIPLGETVEVELVVDGVCPIDYKPADVVLTIDRSGSMADENRMQAARGAATAFLAQTDPLLTRVGLVSFAAAPTVDEALTGDRRRLIAAVNGLAPLGGTDLVRALDASVDVLTGPGARPGVAKVVVLLSDGKHTGNGSVPIPNPPGLAEAIDRARRAGVQVYTIGLGQTADGDTLRAMASDARSFFASPSAVELRDIYLQIARRIEAAELFHSALVTDRVPGNMQFVPGSGRPIEPTASADGRTLTWRLTGVLEPGFRLTYRLRPLQVGLWPTNVEAFADVVDGFGQPGRIVFPVPSVRVTRPAGAHQAFLPILIRERCEDYRLHVVLMLDTSSSMRAPFQPGGSPKFDAAREAALAFVARTDLRRDAVTVAQFDASASIVASGSDAAGLRRAIQALTTHEGTRIDLGLAAVRAHLAGAGRLPGARSVVVLMTDGSPSAGSAAATLAEAQALADAGATLYSVAVGADADRPFLARLSGAGRSYHASDPDALVRLYEQMAGGLRPCVASWGG